MKYQLTCWHPLLTSHMSYTYEALSEISGVPIHVISTRAVEAVRLAQGWTTENARLSHEILPAVGWLRRIHNVVSDDDPSRIHMFGSPFAASRQNLALVLAAVNRRNLFLISEPYLDQPLSYLGEAKTLLDRVKSTARPRAYKLYGAALKHRTRGVFAISDKAVNQYRSVGFRADTVFPFGYFVPGQIELETLSQIQSPPKVAYLGSFIERKGVSLLLEAFGRPEVQATGATLDLFGSAWTAQPLPPRVEYRGPLPFNDVQKTLSQFDLMVVPSLSDGWAVVVNEAVQAGLAVLVSDQVGSAPMIERWRSGEVFQSRSIDDLSEKLTLLLQSPTMMLQRKNAARLLAPHLAPAEAARYLWAGILSAMENSKPPEAPWY